QPLQQLLGAGLRPQGEQPRQRLTQIGERVDPQPLARPHHRVQHRRRLASRLRTDQAPVVPPQRDPPQGPLAEVVVDRQVSLLHVAAQRLPVVQGVADRLPQRTLRQRLAPLLVQPLLQLVQNRLALQLPQLPPLFFPLPPLLLLERVVRGRQ